MKKKLRIGILFGGRSGEHEVSLLSAASILKPSTAKSTTSSPSASTSRAAGSPAPRPIACSDQSLHARAAQRPQSGRRRRTAEADAEFAAAAAVLRSGEPLSTSRRCLRTRTPSRWLIGSSAELAQPSNPLAASLDVVFPVLHGTFGEDGTIQGLFELADIAYVGSGVLGSSAAMDKDAMKRLFAAAGLPQTPYVTLLRSAWRADPKAATAPHREVACLPALRQARQPGQLGRHLQSPRPRRTRPRPRPRRRLRPQARHRAGRRRPRRQAPRARSRRPRQRRARSLGGRRDHPQQGVLRLRVQVRASPENPSIPIIPAKITRAESNQIRAMALAAFRACDCAGLARVDFLMEPARDAKGSTIQKPRIFLNEINTLPGFTSISMYPKLWQASGVPYKKLIDRLITLALERRREKQQTRFTLS